MSFGRLERDNGSRPMSDINMTPLIDVMLVLLVIFMITAPLMTSGLRLDLPRAEGAQPGDSPQVIQVAIDAAGNLHFGAELLDAAAFRSRVVEVARRQPLAEVQLRADRTVAYGRVAELIGIVQEAGLSRIGFITETAVGR